jgi:nitrite reductase/ring-hydroxylating ferredoxin subunit
MLLARHQSSSCALRRQGSAADVRARAGFSSSSTKKTDAAPKLKRAAGELGADAAAIAAQKKERRLTKAAEAAAGKAGTPPKGFPDGWSQLDATIDELLPSGKSTKAVALKTGRVLVLYRVGDSVFCSDVESPAYRYPMHDARVFKADSEGKEAVGGEVPAAECPLDGCVFDLRTGAPLVWCPGGGLVRGVLGALQQKQTPSPLLVHPVFIDGAKRVYVKVRAAK